MTETFIIWLIIGIIALCIGIAASLSESPFMAFICGLFLGASVFECLSELDAKPTAMDVYQGKTVMSYEIINGEKVDSTVVYFEDYLNK